MGAGGGGGGVEDNHEIKKIKKISQGGVEQLHVRVKAQGGKWLRFMDSVHIRIKNIKFGTRRHGFKRT